MTEVIDLAKTQDLSEDDINGVDKNLLDFLNSRTALKHRVLAKEINWSPASFHQWTTGQRPIPMEKFQKLKKVLENYGYTDD